VLTGRTVVTRTAVPFVSCPEATRFLISRAACVWLSLRRPPNSRVLTRIQPAASAWRYPKRPARRPIRCAGTREGGTVGLRTGPRLQRSVRPAAPRLGGRPRAHDADRRVAQWRRFEGRFARTSRRATRGHFIGLLKGPIKFRVQAAILQKYNLL
jgi:hypothetical protein